MVAIYMFKDEQWIISQINQINSTMLRDGGKSKENSS